MNAHDRTEDTAEGSSPDLLAELLPYFKALADATRLRILGLLAIREHTVEQLAEALGVSPSTASHHLAKLAEVGLVSARTESYYSIYRMEAETLEQVARKVLSRADAKPAEPTGAESPFDRKVLRDFLGEDGQIKALPTQQKKRLAVLRHVLAAFEPKTRYTEKQVNAILKRFAKDDYVTVRRYLVDYRLMAREGGGGAYWRVD